LISKSKENKVWDIGFESQSSALFLDGDFSALLRSGKNFSDYFNRNDEFKYNYNSIVDVEVDCEKKTIYFFIYKKQCPYYVSDICSSSFPVLFGFSSYSSPIIEVFSLSKILPSSSYIKSSLKCEEVKWVLILFFILFFFFL
jgi:hypothetical protein